ncbi:sulfatase family protein [Colwellia piezophila]|uniref:sulfatase family protein n=1 Tax=Colwellia piezophila TaxID=211668 RepID=UPI000365C0CA|nr:sulfatase [Colwellia piezophila]
MTNKINLIRVINTLKGILATALLSPALSLPVIAADKKPNILMVLVDDHAFEAISAYESHLKDTIKTPNIDRVANEGMRFTNMSVTTSICSPARAATYTGQYPHSNGVTGNNNGINDDSPRYSHALQKAGYQTWLIGKWHLGSTPKGYDKHMMVKGQGKYFNPTFKGSEGEWQREGYSTDVYADIALEWLAERDKKRPFLMGLQFKAPHEGFEHHARYDNLNADVTFPEPASLYERVHESNSNLKREWSRLRKHNLVYGGAEYGGVREPRYLKGLKAKAPNAMPEHDANNEESKIGATYQQMVRKYSRAVAGNDDNFKRVMDYLEAEGELDNTIVVYMSDQGYWLGQHGFYDKRLIFESSVKTPFLIRYPKLIKAGSVNADMVMNIDIAPTLLDMVGVPVPVAMEGRSFLPMLKGEDAPSDWRTQTLYTYSSGPNHYGVRNDRYTFVHVPGFPPELYDRKNDPDQMDNLGTNPEYARQMAKLEVALQSELTAVGLTEKMLPKAPKVAKAGNKTKKKRKYKKKNKDQQH